MTATRKALGVAVISTLAIGAYKLGGWKSHLEGSLRQEADYPWDLHDNLVKHPVGCEPEPGTKRIGIYAIDLLPTNVLRIKTYNREKGTLSVSFVDKDHRFATDTWKERCP